MNIVDRFYWNPDCKIICKKKELTQFLDLHKMCGEFRLLTRGTLYDIKFKSKGLGYYKLWLEATTLNIRDIK